MGLAGARPKPELAVHRFKAVNQLALHRAAFGRDFEPVVVCRAEQDEMNHRCQAKKKYGLNDQRFARVKDHPDSPHGASPSHKPRTPDEHENVCNNGDGAEH